MSTEDRASYAAFDIDRMGNIGGLREALNSALGEIRERKRDGALFYVAARIAYELNDLSKSEQLVRLLLSLEPEHLNGWLLFAKIYYRRGDMARSNYAVDMIEEIYPALSELNLRHGFKRPSTEEADNGSDAIWKDSNFETETYADICVDQGYLNKALMIYSELSLANPEKSELSRKIAELKAKMVKHG
jgi:tetratricopeptide (TPR) repeat protein